MLRLECTGLTLKEVRDLQEHLRQTPGVDEVELGFEDSLEPGVLYASIPSFHLLVHAAACGVGVAAGGLVIAAGKGASEEVGKALGKAVSAAVGEWMGRFSGKSKVEAEVTLYGPDGKPFRSIKNAR